MGALEQGGRTYVVALLACGWPNHKTYKWSDTRELMEYGLANYDYREYCPQIRLQDVYVNAGVVPDGSPYEEKYVSVEGEDLEESLKLLTTEEERVVVKIKQKDSCEAPIKKGQEAGSVSYYLRDKGGQEILLKELPIFFTEDVNRINWGYVLRYVCRQYCIS